MKDLSCILFASYSKGKLSEIKSKINKLEINLTHFIYKRLWNIEKVFSLDPSIHQMLQTSIPSTRRVLFIEEQGSWKKYYIVATESYLCLYDIEEQLLPSSCFDLRNSVIKFEEDGVLLVNNKGQVRVRADKESEELLKTLSRKEKGERIVFVE